MGKAGDWGNTEPAGIHLWAYVGHLVGKVFVQLSRWGGQAPGNQGKAMVVLVIPITTIKSTLNCKERSCDTRVAAIFTSSGRTLGDGAGRA